MDLTQNKVVHEHICYLLFASTLSLTIMMPIHRFHRY
jgi:hypothetical protein